MIKPVNGHILIEPIKHESFMSTSKEIYEEVGLVIASDDSLHVPISIGDKVYFDAWLAAKFPKNEKEDFWLVRFEDIRAVEKANAE